MIRDFSKENRHCFYQFLHVGVVSLMASFGLQLWELAWNPTQNWTPCAIGASAGKALLVTLLYRATLARSIFDMESPEPISDDQLRALRRTSHAAYLLMLSLPMLAMVSIRTACVYFFSAVISLGLCRLGRELLMWRYPQPANAVPVRFKR